MFLSFLTFSSRLRQVISSLRAPKSSEGYRAIGGGSPLRRITLEQADALSEALAVRGQPASVYVAMRYWKPFTEDAVAQVRDCEVTMKVMWRWCAASPRALMWRRAAGRNVLPRGCCCTGVILQV